jgi:hypothetical protein
MLQQLESKFRRHLNDDFIGRELEQREFSKALQDHWVAMHIHGMGGVGKTTLLKHFSRLAQAQGIAVVRLDSRYIDPSPMGFELALQAALNSNAPLEALAQNPQVVLMLDTYETLRGLDVWLHEVFLPLLPANTLLVLAGREPPSAVWRSNAAWGRTMGALELGNLNPSESRALLLLRGVEDENETIEQLLQFARGYPLALALFADAHRQNKDFIPQESPDLIAMLLERFVRDVPSKLHRQALEACSQVRVLNETQLREALGLPDVHQLFSWLRSLSFIQQGQYGIFPHDLARDVLDTDFRWRDPEAYAEIHHRVREYYFRQMFQAKGNEQLMLLFSLVYLHRNNPILKPYYAWNNFSSLRPGVPNPQDLETIFAAIERFEGAESSALARYWFGRQPQAFVGVYGNSGLVGACVVLELTQILPEDFATDPALAALQSWLLENPIGRGQTAQLIRFQLDFAEYQHATIIHNHLAMFNLQFWVNTPNLAFTLIAYRDTTYWYNFMAYYNFRLESINWKIGGHEYGVFSADFRQRDVLQWMRLNSIHEISTEMQLPEKNSPKLEKTSFAEAVKNALRDYHQPSALLGNPLLRQLPTAPDQNPSQALRLVLWQEAQQLLRLPKEEKFYRALEATYFEPAQTQELAAERLNVPFGTYRYQLQKATERLCELLWRKLG